jgi:poly-gamma-glutamate synthesis protein (capsule biosynthesis protein)
LQNPLTRLLRRLLALSGIFLSFSCADLSKSSGLAPAPPPQDPRPLAEPLPDPPPEPEPPPSYATLAAAGDNLIHKEIYQSVLRDTVYHFAPLYAGIRPYIEAADIAFINQETPLAGESFGYSGYPRFNSPQELGAALADAGFDVINHANNHSMDMGEAGVLATRAYWDALPNIACLGIHQSSLARQEGQVIIEKNHITIGFLAYTYGTNGIPLPRDKPYLISLTNTAIMSQEIDALRKRCDFLVVSMHWGNEYQSSPDPAQERLAAFLAERQVDLVIGHHPHVLQGISLIPRPGGKTMLCFYSLGNCISAQTQDPTLLGGLAYVKIKKLPPREGGGVSIEDYGVIPIVTHYERNYTGFQAYPLHEYPAGLAARHGRKLRGGGFSKAYCEALAAQILGDRLIRHNPFLPGSAD